MDRELFTILERFQSSFSKKAAYYWFVIIMIGLLVRGDHYGVSSIVRWLSLAPGNYWNILNFFNSSGWNSSQILECWWRYCFQNPYCLMIQGRHVFVGDHTNQPKEGRKMPGLVNIHQHSETSSKPSYFRGHVWGFLGLILERGQKHFAVPLWGELNRKERNSENAQSMGTRIVANAQSIAKQMNVYVFLVLDAFFATGTVFTTAASVVGTLGTALVHIITRAKSNAVAYEDPLPEPPGKRGRKRKYGKKIKLSKVFQEREKDFSLIECVVYGHRETIKMFCLDLLWKPIKGKLRFVFALTSRGPIVLICSDLTLPPQYVLELYCRRAAIESTFSVLKNLIGGLSYHFWSKLIEKTSRRPGKNKNSVNVPVSQKILKKLDAIEMFVHLCAMVVGILQILALHFPKQIWEQNSYWLRTFSNEIPSEYIVKGVLSQSIVKNLFKVNTHAIYALIRSRQFHPDNDEELKML
jgi:hypothetical protein